MDNLSHSLVGLAVGEFLHRKLPEEPTPGDNRVRRQLLLLTGCVAGNLPDLDLLLTPLLPEPLGYLLHHRGHTHTLLYALPQALLLWSVLWLIWPAARRLLKKSRLTQIGFGITLGAALVLHLLMDYLNSYGIHPFHPFDSRWFYGDMVFIVEPMFWVLFGIPIMMTAQSRSVKVILISLLLGALVFFTVQDYLPWQSLLLLTALIVVLTCLQYKAGAQGTTGFMAAAFFGVAFVSLQHIASSRATQLVIQQLQNSDPDSQFVDAAMTSYPTNPLCWMFVTVERIESDNAYWLRRGTISLAPALMPVAACPAQFAPAGPAMLAASNVVFHYEYHGDLGTLRKLANENCHFSAWMRFARTPAVKNNHAWDIRFSSSLRGNFTTIDLAGISNHHCSSFIPNWGTPRQDLLMPGTR